jgi:peptidoglycan/LPS O-acetylase OafA/YrhL
MKHVPAFDGLRGMAILMVVAHHIQGPHFPGGFIGVDLFFVLSGFLITRLFILERTATGRISLRNFFIRRALRLMPALWLMVATVLTLACFTGTWLERDGVQAIFALSYTMNFWMAAFWPGQNGIFDNAWSLAVEEQFYLCWALGAFVLLRHRGSTAAATLLASMIAFWCWRRYLLFSGADPMRIYVGLDTRADELLAGCAGALLISLPSAGALIRRTMAILRYTGVAALVALLALSSSVADYYDTPEAAVRYFLVTMPTVTILALAVILEITEDGTSLSAQLLSSPPLVYLGSISYGIYLWHWPLLVWARDNGFDDLLTTLLFGGIGGGLAASISHRYVERPILGLKHRLTQAVGNYDKKVRVVLDLRAGTAAGQQFLDVEPKTEHGDPKLAIEDRGRLRAT